MGTLRLSLLAGPVLLLASGLLGGPMFIYDLRVDSTQPDANVVCLDPHTVTVHSRTVVNMTIYVWVRDWNGNGGADEGLKHANFGAESGKGNLLGDISWTCSSLYKSTGYLPGGTFDHDGDGDKDMGGFYRRPYRDINYDGNFADFAAPSYNPLDYKMWDSSDGDLGDTVLGPDSNVYVGFKVGAMKFTVTSATLGDLNTALQIYPFFYASFPYHAHFFTSDGSNYCLNEPMDPNYIWLSDATLRNARFVTDPSQFLVQAADPVNIIDAPEPAVTGLVLAAGGALLARRRTRRGPARTRHRGTATVT